MLRGFVVIAFLVAVASADSISLTVTPAELRALPVDTVTIRVQDVSKVEPDDFVGIFWPAPEHSNEKATLVQQGAQKKNLEKNVHDLDGLIGFKLLSEGSQVSPSSLEFQVPLVFGRDMPYSFAVYVGNGTQRAAVSQPVGWESRLQNSPSQVRLSLPSGGQGLPTSSMRVMWTQAQAPTQPVAELRLHSNDPASTRVLGAQFFKGSCSAGYKRTDLCAAPANTTKYFREPGVFCQAVMSGLVPGQIYTYRVGDNASSSSGDWAHWAQFVAPPPPGSKAGLDSHVSIVMYGDLGVAPPFHTNVESQPPSMQTMKWALQYLDSRPRHHHKLVWHIGDISYARGHAFLWEWFSALIERASTQAPYHVCIGNHEYDYLKQPWKPSWSSYGSDSGGECGVPYGQRFMMPDNGEASLAEHWSEHHNNRAPVQQPNEKFVRNLWFSHDHGPIHWVTMSTEHDFMPGSPQFAFLEKDMASVDRRLTPWVILVGHRPMYCSSYADPSSVMLAHMRNSIEPLMVKHAVDLAFWGHVHKYERTCAIRQFECAQNGEKWPIHLVVGMAGNTYQDAWQPNQDESGGKGWTASRDGDRTHPKTANDDADKEFDKDSDKDSTLWTGRRLQGYHSQQPDWSLFRTDNFGWTNLEVNRTHLHFQYFGDQTNELHDELWLHK